MASRPVSTSVRQSSIEGLRRIARSHRKWQAGCISAEAAAPVTERVALDAQVAVVLGTQWGDEGKGKLVDILAQQYEVVARAQVIA